MELVLHKDVTAKTMIEGFPGFGLIGTIVTEYLLEHLECEYVGEIVSDELAATVAIHKGEIVRPIGIFYNAKYNLLLVHAIIDVRGFEWKITKVLKELIDKVQAQEVISLEGVMSDGGEDLYALNNKRFEELGAKPVNESVIMGVTASLLLRHGNISCLFAQTHANLPDSRASAKIIEFLDKYLGLAVDTKPLLMQAEIFENKVKGIMQKQNKTQTDADRKQMSYLG